MQKNIIRNMLIIFIFTILMTGCNNLTEGTPESVIPDDRPPVPVEISAVKTGNMVSIISYSGDLTPEDSLVVPSIVMGVIEQVLVDIGDKLQAADPIIRIEDTTYRAQLNQAQAGLTSAQINLKKMENGARDENIDLAEVALDVALTNLSKLQNGPKAEQIGMASAGVDAAQAQLDSILTVTEDERTLAAANLAIAESNLKLAQSEFDKIKWAGQIGEMPQSIKLEQATVAYETSLANYNRMVNPDESDLAPLRATIRQAENNLAYVSDPFTNEDFALAQAGVRQAKLQLALVKDPFTDEDFALVKAGIAQAESAVALAQYQVENSVLRAPFDGVVSNVFVTVGSTASPQLPVIELISEELEVKVDIPEAQLADVYIGQSAAIKVPAHPNEDFPATITTISPSANTSSRTFGITIKPFDPDKKLKAGMFAQISILLEEKVGVTIVPRSAIVSVQGNDVVYVLRDNEETAEMHHVTLGLSDHDRIEILEGVSPSELIIVGGLSDIVDGSTIAVVARTE
ncbi:MAG: hypothetical protein B6242_09065 [Anaerolineaceae bacterium 4572_78]|nr:MAG: hypothetical protein B6242_09065 [Anaerolineaceae bacterium 4572_78]